jgi:hypothetical protein
MLEGEFQEGPKPKTPTAVITLKSDELNYERRKVSLKATPLRLPTNVNSVQ